MSYNGENANSATGGNRIFGLIGAKLSHSFSKQYFTEKFQKLGLQNYRYELFELTRIEDVKELLKSENLRGLNVTIPYKTQIIPFLTRLDAKAHKIGAVNTVKITQEGETVGYNTDYDGFQHTLERFQLSLRTKALIIGKGGAAKAVSAVFEYKGIEHKFLTRQDLQSENQEILVEEVSNAQVIVNATPLGMYPDIASFPALPYERIMRKHVVIDLVYNPENTLFLQKSDTPYKVNGLPMLYAQAEKAWEIFGE